MQERCEAFSAPTAYRPSHVHDVSNGTHRLACPRSYIVEKPLGEDALRASAIATPKLRAWSAMDTVRPAHGMSNRVRV